MSMSTSEIAKAEHFFCTQDDENAETVEQSCERKTQGKCYRMVSKQESVVPKNKC